MLDNAMKSTTGESTSRFPRSIAFIISNEFCERFSYYGMRTILALYLTIKLGFSDDSATVLFHVFTALVYLFPVFGAILADSFLGKFKTILYLSCVYAIGSILIAVGAIPSLSQNATIYTVIGLVLIGFGSGGIKPCVSAFGGDQFRLPEQAKQLATFFSFFYFAINAGSLISTFLTPILREDVHCFGDSDCYSLAFGVPGALMIVSIFIFMAGRAMYVVKKPSGNIIVQVTQCVINALSEKSKQQQKLPHWLDYAVPKFGHQLVEDIKGVLKVLVLFLPLPLYWALFDQQGSRWTFQATRMDGNIGFMIIKPDQLQVVNPLLILIFIPIFDCALYPLLARVGLKRPLQKLAAGGFLAALAFIISGLIEIRLEKTYPVMPKPNESQVRIFNGLPCNYSLSTDIVGMNTQQLNSLGVLRLNVKVEKSLEKNFKFDPLTPECPKIVEKLKLSPGISDGFFLNDMKNKAGDIKYFVQKVEKSRNGNPKVQLLVNLMDKSSLKLISETGETVKTFNNIKSKFDERFEINPMKYSVFADGLKIGDVDLLVGGVYTLIVSEMPDKNINIKLHTISPPNSVHMLWLLPQYIIITMSEVMFSVTGLEFAYAEAPTSMKSFLQAFWLLTVALGNVIVVIIAEAKFFQSQASEFFLFSGMMIGVTLIFVLLANRYKYVINRRSFDRENGEMNAVENGNNGGVPPSNEPQKQTFSNSAYIED